MNRIPVIDMDATGNNIKRLRKAAGLTIRDIQEIFGFTTPQAIYKWQRGAAMPSLENCVALAAVLGVSLDELIVCESPCGLIPADNVPETDSQESGSFYKRQAVSGNTRRRK